MYGRQQKCVAQLPTFTAFPKRLPSKSELIAAFRFHLLPTNPRSRVTEWTPPWTRTRPAKVRKQIAPTRPRNARRTSSPAHPYGRPKLTSFHRHLCPEFSLYSAKSENLASSQVVRRIFVALCMFYVTVTSNYYNVLCEVFRFRIK